jgi:hypothetical protein
LAKFTLRQIIPSGGIWRNLSVVGEKHGKVNTRQGNKFCHMKACYKRL